MANWTALKAAIDAVITTNDNNEITGAILNSAIDNLIDNIANGATFKGIATIATVPGTPDGPEFYLAGQKGTYTNFGAAVVSAPGVTILAWDDGAWTVTRIDTDDLNIANSFRTLYFLSGAIPNIAFDAATKTLTWDDVLVFGAKNDSQYRVKIAAGSVTFIDNQAEVLFIDTRYIPIGQVDTLTFDITQSDSPLKIGAYYTTTGDRFRYNNEPYQVPLFFYSKESGVQYYYSIPPMPLIYSDNLSNYYAKESVDALIETRAVKSLFSEAVIPTSLTKYYNASSHTLLGDTFEFGADGDYFEFEIRLDGDITTNFNALGLIGDGNSLKNTCGWLSATEFRIRDDASTWKAFTGLTPYSELGDIVKVKVLRNGANFELYLNDALAGTVAVAGFTTMYIDRIGNTYATGGSISLFSMRNFDLHSTAIGDVSSTAIWKSSLISTEITVANDTNKGILDDFNPNIVVDFDPTGGTDGIGLFDVYVKSKSNKDYYTKYALEYEVDAGIRIDNWRIKGVYLYKYSGGVFTDTGLVLLNVGETEFAYKQTGKTDFTGGYHGDQELTDVEFFANGVRIDSLASAFTIECSEFSYIQKSEMLETDNVTRVVEANNIKHTVFTIDKVNIFIRQTWAAVINLELCYNTLVPTYFDTADFYTNETFVIEDVTDAAPNGNVLIGNERNFRCWNEDTDIACEIIANFKEDKVGSHSRIWCSPGAYNKLYISYIPSAYNTSVSEIFESNTEIIFKIGK